jgi:phospholipase/lecithinase/hemolysin
VWPHFPSMSAAGASARMLSGDLRAVNSPPQKGRSVSDSPAVGINPTYVQWLTGGANDYTYILKTKQQPQKQYEHDHH